MSGDIRGAMGTIGHREEGARTGLLATLTTLLAIVGPGLIVMVGDNDTSEPVDRPAATGGAPELARQRIGHDEGAPVGTRVQCLVKG